MVGRAAMKVHRSRAGKMVGAYAIFNVSSKQEAVECSGLGGS